MSDASESRLSGVIVVDPDQPTFRGAEVRIFCEDVGRADASSITLASAILHGAGHGSGSTTRIPYEMHVPGPLEHCTLRVHISLGGSDEVQRGDLVSVQHHAALESREGGLEIPVQAVD